MFLNRVDEIQGHLVALMGLLSVPAENRDKYLADGYPSVTQEEIDWLESIAVDMPTELSGWARPGASGTCGSRLDGYGAYYLSSCRAIGMGAG